MEHGASPLLDVLQPVKTTPPATGALAADTSLPLHKKQTPSCCIVRQHHSCSQAVLRGSLPAVLLTSRLCLLCANRPAA